MGLFIIAVIVLLICVCLSRVGSKDLREVAVAVEIGIWYDKDVAKLELLK